MAKKSSSKKTKTAGKPKPKNTQEGTMTDVYPQAQLEPKDPEEVVEVEVEDVVEAKTPADDPYLPKKSLFRIDEVAVFFSVTERTIRLWIEHGILRAVKKGGVIRVLRESILECHIVDRQNSA